MFGINYSELLVIAAVALVVIGPKDLPRVMRQVGRWIGRAQGMARHFRTGIDTMIREAELEEMEKKWREENERIMREHPLLGPGAEMLPLTGPAAASAEPAWEAAAEIPPGPEAAAPPAAAAPDPEAPELPLAPPPAPKRELP
ncbi:MAG: sec-independent protein translocase protein TatB [Sphingomonadales bacterium]|jgi:sec-independent protein translocase protein TatB|nr:sec-independent protein translocase protein TatB [Sphingomonadales bacterium]